MSILRKGIRVKCDGDAHELLLIWSTSVRIHATFYRVSLPYYSRPQAFELCSRYMRLGIGCLYDAAGVKSSVRRRERKQPAEARPPSRLDKVSRALKEEQTWISIG